jgi:hypothetical protein
MITKIPAIKNLAPSALTSTIEKAASDAVNLAHAAKRSFHTVYAPTVIEKKRAPKESGKQGQKWQVTDPGHIAIVVTPEEQTIHRLPGRHFGHSLASKPDRIGPPAQFTDASGKTVEVKPWHGPGTADISKDKPIDDGYPGVRKIDHGPLTQEQGDTLRGLAGKPFDERYDTTGQTAPNCVTAANALHLLLNLTKKKVPPFTTPQDAAKLVKK